MEATVQPSDESMATLHGMRRNGWRTFAIGLLLFLPASLAPFDPDTFTVARPGDPWFVWFGAILMYAILGVAFVSGAMLIAGGLAFRKAVDWGRRLVVAAIALNIAFYAVVSIAWVGAIPCKNGLSLAALPEAAAMPAVAGIWLPALLLALRYFRSQQVRLACGIPARQ